MWLGQMFHQKYVISLKCGRMNACWCVLQRLTWRRVGLGQHHSSHQCMRLEDVVVDPRNEALHRIPGNLLTLIQVQTQQTKSPSVGGNPLILTDRCRVNKSESFYFCSVLSNSCRYRLQYQTRLWPQSPNRQSHRQCSGPAVEVSSSPAGCCDRCRGRRAASCRLEDSSWTKPPSPAGRDTSLTFTSRGQQGAVLTLWRMLSVGCIFYCTICVSR